MAGGKQGPLILRVTWVPLPKQRCPGRSVLSEEGPLPPQRKPGFLGRKFQLILCGCLSHCVIQASLKLGILLLQPLEC